MRARSEAALLLLLCSGLTQAAELFEVRLANEAETGVFALYEQLDGRHCLDASALRGLGVQPLPQVRRSEFATDRVLACFEPDSDAIRRIDREQGVLVLNRLNDQLLAFQRRSNEIGSSMEGLRIDHDTFYAHEHGRETRLVSSLTTQLMHDDASLRLSLPVDWSRREIPRDSLRAQYEQQFDQQPMRLRLGDDILADPWFQASVPVRQLSLLRDLSLTPDARAFLPDLQALPALESASSLMLRLSEGHDLRINPRDSYPLLSGDNVLRHEYVDAMGVTRTAEHRLYVDSAFVRNSETLWDIRAGQARTLPGQISPGPGFLDAGFEHNWRDDINLGMRLHGNDQQGALVSGSISHLRAGLGLLRADLGSQIDRQGTARPLFAMAHRYTSTLFSLDSRYAWRDHDAALITDTVFGQSAPMRELRSQFSTLGRLSFRAGYLMQRHLDGQYQGLVSAGVSWRMQRDWRLTTSWSQGLGELDNQRVSVELIYSDGRNYASSGYYGEPREQGAGWLLERNESWRDGALTVSAMDRPGLLSPQLAVRGYNQDFSGQLRMLEVDDGQRYEAGLRGSFYVGRFGLLAERPQSSGLLLVHTSAPDLRVTLDEYRSATTNADGIARFDNVSYFNKHLLRFDQGSLPLEQRDNRGTVPVRVRDFGMAYYRLPLSWNNELELELRNEGELVPDGRLSVVNQVPLGVGRYLISDEPGGWRGTLDTAHGQCYFDVPARTQPGPRQLSLSCIGKLTPGAAMPQPADPAEHVDCRPQQAGKTLFDHEGRLLGRRDETGCMIVTGGVIPFYSREGVLLD